MIQWVIESLEQFGPTVSYHFVIQKQHEIDYQMGKILRGLVAGVPNIYAYDKEEVPHGAAQTVLLMKEFVNSGEPLLICNGDQYFVGDVSSIIQKNKKTFDGVIPYFYATHPRWSFIETDAQARILKTAEKDPISNKATVGLYYFRKGSDFVESAQRMIYEQQYQVNGEYYICPVFNYLIQAKKHVMGIKVDQMWSFGTPEDTQYFEKYYKGDLS